MSVDLIITYVDSKNKDWQANYEKTSKSDIRYFRTNKNILKYLLRSVSENLSFINNVFLVVQNESEVPDYINKRLVKIVTHDTFIPLEYLPAFNSATIETFFHLIPGLSENYIYLNDDNFIWNNLIVNDFFDESFSKIYCKFNSTRINANDNFSKLLVNDFELVYEQMRSQEFVLQPMHTVRAYFKKDFRRFYIAHKLQLLNSLTQFRNSTNYTIHANDLYLDKLGKIENKSNITVEIVTDKNLSEKLVRELLTSEVKSIVIADLDLENNIFENPMLLELLDTKFSKPSQYEIGGDN